ncbi:MAG TPA: DUF1732 domain-containing protein [Firmicutes bacterium]|nr:DUF1732 domain-containing protein [Bacillota bacterium]
MASSMTGWGTAAAPWFNINIRGINSKYREIVLHLPPEMFAIEARAHEFFSSKIQRGRVDIYVNIHKPAGARKIKINEALLKSAYNQLSRAFKKAGIKENPPADVIFEKVEGIITTDEPAGRAYEWEKVRVYFEKAAADFIAMKNREGVRLVKDMLKRFNSARAETEKIEVRFSELKKMYEEKTAKKMAELIEKNGQKGFLGADIVDALEKYDINEEIVRLKSHDAESKKIAAQEGALGRKMDFLAQELLRESNTISAKVQDPVILSGVMAIKENADKIREQAQNLE